jgi:acyl-CoA synthetase (AMP-forming)/AMP-acid ligase II
VCVGRPPPGIQIRILPLKDDAHSKPSLVASSSSSISSASSSVERFLDTCTSQVEFLGDGEVGEVVTRGPHLMVRYWNDPRATRAAMDAAGTWFRTGDLGVLIDSQLWLVGRAKDVVKTGGENVACAEVERVLLRHPAVAAAAVLGLPDARLGERVVAAVVLRDGWTWQGNHVHMLQGGSDARRSARGRQRAVDGGGAASQHESASSRRRKLVDGAELQMHCRQEGMAGFKLPRTIINMSALPLNATGKVVKARLKEQLAEMVVEAEGTNTGPQGAVRARL